MTDLFEDKHIGQKICIILSLLQKGISSLGYFLTNLLKIFIWFIDLGSGTRFLTNKNTELQFFLQAFTIFVFPLPDFCMPRFFFVWKFDRVSS